MSTKLTLLQVLTENSGQYVSGQELAGLLGVSRNSVWKAANKLKTQGYNIESISGTGYRLINSGDILSEDYIKEKISHPCRVRVLEKVDSTNNAAKLTTCSEIAQIIIANEQTGGRGRLGRDFYSPGGAGLYMTIAFKPSFGLDKAMLTTAAAAVAVSRAVEEVSGLRPKIKWVNDIYLGEKKLCGILTEAESNFETGLIEKIIVGIGVNCFRSSVPDELKDVMAFMENPKHDFSRNELAAAIANIFFSLLDNFDKPGLIREYKSKSFILGEQIRIFNPAIARSMGLSPAKEKEGIKARAIDIDENGGLVVEFLEGRRSREMETLTTGEITIRKING